MPVSRTTFAAVGALCALIVLGASEPTAKPSSPASRSPDMIEEDWELVVGTPDVIGVGPQVTTMMTASGKPKDPFIAFGMNYRRRQSFQPGGMQIEVWSKDRVIARESQKQRQFQTPHETVSWTQKLSLSPGSITYAVTNGQSITWGRFGQDGEHTLSVTYRTALNSLAAYSPLASAKHSGASFEANRVTSLKLLRVRYYSHGFLYYTDTNTRTIVGK